MSSQISSEQANNEQANNEQALQVEQLVEQQLADVNRTPFANAWEQLHTQYPDYVTSFGKEMWSSWLSGDAQGNVFLEQGKRLIAYFLHEIYINTQLLVALVVLALFAALIERLQDAFTAGRVARVANMLMVLVLLSLAVQSLSVSLEYAREAVSRMSDFMLAMFPLFLSMMALAGRFVSLMLLEPFLLLMTQVMGRLIHFIVFPLLFFATLLHMASALNEHYKVTRLATLLNTVALTVMGVMFTAFLAVFSVQGVFAATSDGLTMRAAKFIAGNFVPVVGRLFADAADAVFSASMIAKNTVGLIGLFTLVVICAFPALKILVIALIYRLCSALLQPLGDSPLVQCLETIGNCLLYLFAAVAMLGLMFFLSLTVLIGLGNVTLLYR